MSSSSDDEKCGDRIGGFPSWALDSSTQKAIERSQIHILPERIRSQIASANKAAEALNLDQIASATYASQLLEQQRSLASEVLDRHVQMFAAVEAATRSQQEIGHAARAAIKFMQMPGFEAASQAIKLLSPLMDSNQLTPPVYPAHASKLEISMAEKTRAASAVEAMRNLHQGRDISSLANSLRFSHLTIPNLDLVTGNVSRLMQDILAGVEQGLPDEAHELREYYEGLISSEDAPAESLTVSNVLTLISLIIGLLALSATYASYQSDRQESRFAAEYREQDLQNQRELLTELHTINHHCQKANGMDSGQASGLTEYVVVRSVNLRTHKGTGPDSHIITTLHPNQKLELIQRGTHPYKKWIYVSYFDHIEELPRYGWVYKKYLKRVGP